MTSRSSIRGNPRKLFGHSCPIRRSNMPWRRRAWWESCKSSPAKALRRIDETSEIRGGHAGIISLLFLLLPRGLHSWANPPAKEDWPIFTPKSGEYAVEYPPGFAVREGQEFPYEDAVMHGTSFVFPEETGSGTV